MLQYQDQEWEIAQRIERNKKGARIPIPEWYYEKVGVPDELRWFWTAYWELDTERDYVEGVPRKIPWSKCLQYAQYYNIDFDYFRDLIVALDTILVDFKTKQRKKEAEKERNRAGNR